jgi:hypothetical protein
MPVDLRLDRARLLGRPRAERVFPREVETTLSNAVSSRVMDDLGAPSSYLALEPGTAVYTTEGEKIGEVQYVFDGVVIDASMLPGGLRFADAVQVAQIFERGVVLGLTAAEAERLPEPSENPGVLEVTGVEVVDRTELGEKLRRAWDVVSGKGRGER